MGRGPTDGGVGALLTSPVGKTRADLQLFHATATSGLSDWRAIGTLWPGQAGYSSLLAARSLLEPNEAAAAGEKAAPDFMVLFEEGGATGAMYQVTAYSCSPCGRPLLQL